MDVYIDVLFIENIIINYFILFLTSRLTRQKASSLRILAGALIGSVYVCFLVLFPNIRIYLSIPAKILLSAAMIAATFNIGGAKLFARALLVFYGITLVFAGCSFAMLFLDATGSGFVESGVYYIYSDTRWTTILLAVSGSLIFVRTMWELFRQRAIKDNMMVNLSIHFNESSVNANALVDTGNHLMDPLSRLPVVIVEFRVLSSVLPESIRRVFEENGENDIGAVTEVISASPWINRFRLIPFASLGRENGMMIGFKPDYIEIGEKNVKLVHDAIVAVYNRALSKNDGYSALVGPELM